MTAPAPLTPADCDLRDFGFMPLDVRRFRDSDLVALEDPEAIVAAVMLWGAAWHQVPAASLPDDDRTLAQLAGYGRAVKEWQRVKPGAMRGFVLCSDGRLYHPHVATKARDAWTGKLKQRHRTFCATVRKHNERNPDRQVTAPDFEEWLERGRPEKVADFVTLPPRSAGPLFEAEQPEMSQATNANVTRDNGDMSRTTKGSCHANVTRDTASKGEGQGEGEGEGDSYHHRSHGSDADLVERIASAGCVSTATDRQRSRAAAIVETWTKAGLEEPTILSAIERALAKLPPGETVTSLAFYDQHVRRAAKRPQPSRSSTKATPIVAPAPDSDDPRIPQIRKRLHSRLGGSTYGGWLAPTAMSLNGTSLLVQAASPFHADWIRQHFLDDLKAETRAVASLDEVRVTT